MANSNKDVQVNLRFKGDMSDVEKKLQQLQATLTDITSGKGLNNLAFGPEINKAIGDATKLQVILKNTTMANGNLDLTKFRSELQKSGLSVKELGNSLLSLGPKGSQAFSQLTQSIISAEIPLKRTSTLLSNFATTLKNTAKWQISSTILHGFMSSISQAYGYSKDLNESLNNIRIVSKQNTEQMADFAKEANKAAKELSVTTTAYTDAALIFYQQGLEGNAVTKRTDVVAKMSNVTKNSVDEVSSYMTAIWNNFDDGSESLEHYADVITGLGAATASSSAEIAGGLEKFAAVADVVGLSYDYATAALATVVAQTRQSADTVGTAFKTLFARIEGLKLGETLEDGVDLNKYSKALATIGVNVVNANGELRNMDDILDDMGAKWKQIGKEQQVAVAQTVAGTRQYNQLVALMDNWDKVQKNLQVARSSDGELQKQADIYAESWEAAGKRVRAAWESIYASLFDDKFFINLTNGLGSFIEGIDKIIKSLGGLKGILPIITSALVNLFNKDIANGVNNFVYNLQIGTKKTQEGLIQFKEQFSNIFKDFTVSDSLSSAATADAMANQAAFQQAILDREKQLNAEGKEISATEKMINQILAERISLTNQEMINTAKETEALQNQLQIITRKAELVLQQATNNVNKNNVPQEKTKAEQAFITDDFNLSNESIVEEKIANLKKELEATGLTAEEVKAKIENAISLKALKDVEGLQESYGALTEQCKIFIDTLVDQGPEQAKIVLEGIQEQALELAKYIGEDTEAFQIFENTLQKLNSDTSAEEQERLILELSDAIENLGNESYYTFKGLIDKLKETNNITEQGIKILEQYFETSSKLGRVNVGNAAAKYNADAVTKAGINLVNQGFVDNEKIQKTDVGANFANATKAAMNFGTALNSVNNLIDQLMDKEASFGDKMLALLTNGSMAAMMMGNSFKGIQGLLAPITKNANILLASTKATAIANKASNAEIRQSLILEEAKLARAKESLATGNLLLQTETHKSREKRIQLAVENSEKTIEEAELAIAELTAIEQKKELQSEIILSAYKEGEISFATALLALKKLETTEDEKQVGLALIKAGILKTIKGTGTKIVGLFEKIGEGISTTAGALGISAGLFVGILIALAAAVAAVAVAYKSYQNHLKAVAESDKMAVTRSEEKRQALEEEADSVKELSDAYKDLKESQDKLSPEEMKAKVFDLCMQYNQETLALKALAGEYKNLEDAISDVQNANSEKLVEAAEREKKIATASARSTTIVTAGHRADNWGDTIDLQGLGLTATNTENGRLRRNLEGLGLQIGRGSGKVQTDELVNTILKDPEKFQEIIEQSSATAAKTLKEIYDALTPQIEAIKNANDTLKSNLGYTFDTSQIKNDTTFENSVKKLAQQAIEENLFTGENAKEEAISWARSFLGQLNDEFKEYEQESIIIDALVGKKAPEKIRNKVRKALEALPEEVSKATIAANADLVKLLGNGNVDQGIKIFAEKFADLMELNTEKALGEGLAAAAASEEGPSDGQITALYGAGFDPGMSQEEFGKLDLTQQRMAMLEFYLNMEEMSDETKNKIIGDIEDQIAETTEKYEEFAEKKEKLEDRYERYMEKILNKMTEKYGAKWDEAYVRRLEAKDAELTEEEKKDKELLELESKRHSGGNNRISSLVKDMDAAEKTEKKYQNSLAQLQKQLSDVDNKIIDTAAGYEALKVIIEEIDKATDDFQKSFQTLSDSVAEFNEKGYVTMDTLQSLWTMDDQYLASLQLVDGQLKLNTNTLEVVANAQIDAMEAAALHELELTLLAKEEETEAGLDSTVASSCANKIGSLNDVIAKVREGAAAWREYAEEQAKAITGNANLNENQKNAIDAFYNKIALAESTRKQIGTKNFGTAMNVKPAKSSGGSKKSKEEKDIKEWADEFDRFYPYQKVIEDLTDALSDLAKEQEHMAGGELVGAIRKQNRLLQEQKKAYQELAKEQKKYQKEMQADLAKYGMSFDTASGNIINYAQSTQAMLDQYNAAIEKYNKSAQEDADKKALEAVEKEYNKFKTLVSNYQGILTEIQDTENNLDDIYYEQIANNLKEFEIMVQVKLDIGEAQRMVNDFISKINKNFKTLRKSTEEWMDVFNTALKNAHTYIDGDLGTINVDMDALNKVKGAIDSGDYGHEGAMFASETEAVTKYKELAEQLKDDANDLYELYKQAWEDYIDAIDESIEAWEEIIKDFDNINDTLDHYEKIIELLHGHQDTDQGYEELMALYNKQMTLQLAKQSTLRKQIDTMQAEYDELIAQGAKENDKDVKAIKDAINEANKELEGSIEDYLETINKAFDKQITKAIDDRITNGLGFNPKQMSEDWAMQQKAAEGYYDETERIYQLDKIRRKFNDAIKNTTDLKQQQQLAKLRDAELKDLEEMNKLSEHRVEIAEKKLAVAQAEAALEEAQNNKSQMRLQRDSQGNWSYQFVADEDNISEKQQALADTSDALYQKTKEAYEDMFNDITTLAEEWKEKLIEIQNDTTLSAEEKTRKMQETDAYYQNLIGAKAKEMGIYKQELGEATANALIQYNKLDHENYKLMNKEQKTLVDELKTKSIDNITAITTATTNDYKKIQEQADLCNKESIAGWDLLEKTTKINIDNMKTEGENFYRRIDELNKDYDEAVKRSEEASGIAWSNVGAEIDRTGQRIEEVTRKVEDCVARTQALSDFRSRVMEIEAAWNSVKDAIINAMNELDGYLKKLLEIKEMQDVVKNNESTATGSFDYTDIASSGSGNSGSGGSGGGKEEVTISYVDDIRSSHPGNPNNIHKLTVGFSNGEKLTKEYNYDSANSTGIKWVTRKNMGWKGTMPTSLKTGGYTGSWSNKGLDSNNGKLAILHQKELVLNAKDTENMLQAVKTLRNLGNLDTLLSPLTEELISYPKYVAQSKAYMDDWGRSVITPLIEGTISEPAATGGLSFTRENNIIESVLDELINSPAYTGVRLEDDYGEITSNIKDIDISTKELVYEFMDALNNEIKMFSAQLENNINMLIDNMNYNSDTLIRTIQDTNSQQKELKQNVHIDASFPNASSSREIENAFDNLINVASQRVGYNKYDPLFS